MNAKDMLKLGAVSVATLFASCRSMTGMQKISDALKMPERAVADIPAGYEVDANYPVGRDTFVVRYKSLDKSNKYVTYQDTYVDKDRDRRLTMGEVVATTLTIADDKTKLSFQQNKTGPFVSNAITSVNEHGAMTATGSNYDLTQQQLRDMAKLVSAKKDAQGFLGKNTPKKRRFPN